jgi:MFS transporter, ACS family, tartrate transporter
MESERQIGLPGVEIGESTRQRITVRLIPYLMFVYFLAYLDRANLGVAKFGMQTELHFDETVIGLGAGIFFFGYLLLDLPGSLIVEHWSARKWIARIMLTWGLVAMLMGFIGTRLFGHSNHETQFYVLRFLLGTAEAGFFPGVIVYLSHWYRVEDRARAQSYFIVTQPLAVAIGIPLSQWILDRAHWFGLAGWRWVFIMEGLAPLMMGFVTLRYLIDSPGQASWLSAEQKEWLSGALRADQTRKTASRRVRLVDALRYPQTYLLIAVSFLVITGNQALIIFMPSITNAMKDMPAVVRTVAAAAPYVCSAAGILLNGFWTHRTGALRWHTAIPMIATGVSLSFAVLAEGHSSVMIVLLCLAGFTSQSYQPAFWTIPTALLRKSAAAAAVGLITLGNLGGFAGPYVFGYLKTLTGDYQSGLLLLAGCMTAAGLLATLIRLAPREGASS